MARRRRNAERLEVRTAKKSDVPALIHLGQRAFTGPGADERWKRFYHKNPHLPLRRVLVAERGGLPLGVANLLDLKMAIDGKPQPMDGVAAVAVDPLARRQGVADRLLREAIVDARKRSVPVSVLYAFRASFYRKYGYAPVEIAHVLHAKPSVLPDSPERVRVRAMEDRDLPRVRRCYAASLAGRTGLLERSELWWNWRVLVEGQDRVVYEAPRGGIEGYALCTMVERGTLGARRFRVSEFAATTPRALRGLVGWLASLSDEIGTVELFLPADRSISWFLADPGIPGPTLSLQNLEPAGYLGWGAMARVTHLEKALACRRGRGVRGSVALELSDPLVPENAEPVTVRFGAGRPSVRRGAHARSRLRGPIDVFTQVWLGAVPASQARAAGAIECDEKTAVLLDRAWHGPPPYLGPHNGF